MWARVKHTRSSQHGSWKPCHPQQRDSSGATPSLCAQEGVSSLTGAVVTRRPRSARTVPGTWRARPVPMADWVRNTGCCPTFARDAFTSVK